MENMSMCSFEVESCGERYGSLNRKGSNSHSSLMVFTENEGKGIIFNKIVAILCMIASSIAAGSTSVTCKMAFADNPNLNTFDYLLMRSFTFMTASVVPILYYRVNPFVFPPKFRKWFAFVLAFSLFGVTLFYASLKYLPVVKSSLIYNVNPIVISILGVFLLKEPISCYELFCIIGAFFGVFLMLNHADVDNGVSIELQLLAAGFACVACLSGSVTSIFLRFFNKESSSMVYPFHYALALTVITILLIFVYPSIYNFEYYSTYSITMFMISGIANVFTLMLNSLSFKLADVSLVAPFAYITPVFSFICDLFIFDTSFDFIDITGIILVLLFLLLKLKKIETTNK